MTDKTHKTKIIELADDDLEKVQGAGQDGNDLLIVNNGDGSDFLEADSRDTESLTTGAGPGGGPHVKVFSGRT